jgi:hypothetical protein
VELTAGDHHTCARLADGTLRCWGLQRQRRSSATGRRRGG